MAEMNERAPVVHNYSIEGVRRFIRDQFPGDSTLDQLTSLLRSGSFKLSESTWLPMNPILESASAVEMTKIALKLLRNSVIGENLTPLEGLYKDLGIVQAKAEHKALGNWQGFYLDKEALINAATISSESKKRGKKQVEVLPDLIYLETGRDRKIKDLIVVDIEGDPQKVVDRVMQLKAQTQTPEWQEMMQKKVFTNVLGEQEVPPRIQLYVAADQFDATAEALTGYLLKDFYRELEEAKLERTTLSNQTNQMRKVRQLSRSQEKLVREIRERLRVVNDRINSADEQIAEILYDANITIHAMGFESNAVLAMAEDMYESSIIEIEVPDKEGPIQLPTPNKLFEYKEWLRDQNREVVTTSVQDHSQDLGVSLAVQKENEKIAGWWDIYNEQEEISKKEEIVTSMHLKWHEIPKHFTEITDMIVTWQNMETQYFEEEVLGEVVQKMEDRPELDIILQRSDLLEDDWADLYEYGAGIGLLFYEYTMGVDRIKKPTSVRARSILPKLNKDGMLRTGLGLIDYLNKREEELKKKISTNITLKPQEVYEEYLVRVTDGIREVDNDKRYAAALILLGAFDVYRLFLESV